MRSPSGTHVAFYEYIRQIGRTYHEQCGVLFWDSDLKLLRVYMVGNVDPEPRYHFQMLGVDVRRLIRAVAPLVPVGIFHTHVERDNVGPSPHDIEVIAKLNEHPRKRRWYGAVYHVRTKRVTYYTRHGVQNTVNLQD